MTEFCDKSAVIDALRKRYSPKELKISEVIPIYRRKESLKEAK